jgi:hypothetical protein
MINVFSPKLLEEAKIGHSAIWSASFKLMSHGFIKGRRQVQKPMPPRKPTSDRNQGA